MDEKKEVTEITADDLREALKDMNAYVDITEEDLMAIYSLALKHAKERQMPFHFVRDIMNVAVIAVKGDTGLDEAAKLMSENRISGMPVVDEDNHVVGVISEADLLCMAGKEKGHSFTDVVKHILGEPLHKHRHGSRVRDIMSSPPVTVTPHSAVKEAARILTERRIKRLPVVDENGILLGIVSRADIVKAIG